MGRVGLERPPDRFFAADVRRGVARRLRDELDVIGGDVAQIFGYTHRWMSKLRTEELVSA